MADYDVQYDKDSGDWSAKRAGASRATDIRRSHRHHLDEARPAHRIGTGNRVSEIGRESSSRQTTYSRRLSASRS